MKKTLSLLISLSILILSNVTLAQDTTQGAIGQVSMQIFQKQAQVAVYDQMVKDHALRSAQLSQEIEGLRKRLATLKQKQAKETKDAKEVEKEPEPLDGEKPVP